MAGYTREGLVDLGGFRTWYGVVGELDPGGGGGPAPLVVLHGGPGATHDYLLPLAALAESGRAVVFYDQVGNGRSSHFPDRGAEFYTVQLFVAELAGLVAHLGISQRYHVLGQSWGGFLAQEHALTSPPGLSSLVLSNTAASFPHFVAECNRLRGELPPDVEATLRRHEAAGTTDDPEYARACAVFYGRHVCRLPEPWPEPVRASFGAIEEDPTVYHTTNGPSEFHVVGSFRHWESLGRLPAIGVPTLVLSGRHDEATPSLQAELVAGLARAEQVVLEGASHLSMWEQPEAYLGAVSDFLARHD
ncbi:MAG TPA: proline iminopeptidase-family hydrolase [Acidimicrobiales bacterium]|nr:proline iminopeptidase-family hydrolase [Acidimicrobiales bacterium]